MGSLLLECPLCCSEKFSSHHSLKYHLLSIIDNLICPACSTRFDKILDLAEHLGRECHEAEASVSAPNLNIKQEVEEDPDNENVLSKSILAKALMKTGTKKGSKNSQAANAKQKKTEEADDPQQETNDEEDGEDLFYCSSCAIHFTSVEDHLQKYHEGHQVFIQDGDEESVFDRSGLTDDNTTEEIFGIDNDDEKLIAEDTNDSDSQDESSREPISVVKSEFPQILNTVQQQECFDKDGRLYTRKVVRIEKFWDENSVASKRKDPPITEKYVIRNGMATKLPEDDECNYERDINEKIVEIHQCTHCDVQFSKLEDYYKHKCSAMTHPIKCGKCSATFANLRALCSHMRVHKMETAASTGPHLCEECNTDFPSYKSLRLHKRMHDPIKSREIEAPVSYGITGDDGKREEPREMFLCQICNKTYDKQYEEAHMNYHKDDNNFDCDICNRKFHTKPNLEMHLRVHTNGKKFTCSYCKKAFLTYESLQEHVATLCQKRRYECQYCGRRFARPHEKVKHERIHTGEKPHVCEICGKAFRVSYCLTLHMRTHSGTRPYQCPHCQKRFKAHSVFNHHLLTHSDVRAYKCPYCPKAFKTGVQLAGHKNSHIKPFTCTECNRPFASLYAVRAHMETHKRENNLKFSCWLCGASYARAFALRDHVKEHHGDEQATEEATSSIVLEADETVLMELDGKELEEGMETVVEAVVE